MVEVPVAAGVLDFRAGEVASTRASPPHSHPHVPPPSRDAAELCSANEGAEEVFPGGPGFEDDGVVAVEVATSNLAGSEGRDASGEASEGLAALTPTARQLSVPRMALSSNRRSWVFSQLTQSDANNGGSFSVPSFCVDFIFPKLDFDANPPVPAVPPVLAVPCRPEHGTIRRVVPCRPMGWFFRPGPGHHLCWAGMGLDCAWAVPGRPLAQESTAQLLALR